MPMKIRCTEMPGIILFEPKLNLDERGVFSETFKEQDFAATGSSIRFLQDNRSLSYCVGTVRGLHYQKVPHAQAKLVSVQCGRIFDVAVDLRQSSPTFGEHVTVELTAERGEQIFIPAGFAHGFCTLEPNTVVTYKVDQYYAPAYEAGLHWLTPDLKIEWPCGIQDAHLSAKDALLPDHIASDMCFP